MPYLSKHAPLPRDSGMLIHNHKLLVCGVLTIILLREKIINIIVPKISNLQHRFMKGRLTTTQLLNAHSNIHKIFDNKGQSDLSKAFDTVPHDLLLHKLKSLGIQGRLLAWIKNYLINCLQRVTCDGGRGWLSISLATSHIRHPTRVYPRPTYDYDGIV